MQAIIALLVWNTLVDPFPAEVHDGGIHDNAVAEPRYTFVRMTPQVLSRQSVVSRDFASHIINKGTNALGSCLYRPSLPSRRAPVRLQPLPRRVGLRRPLDEATVPTFACPASKGS